MKPLFIPLKKQFFLAFQSGEKNTEYRKLGPRWNSRTCYKGRPAVLSLGYGKKSRLIGTICEVALDRDIVKEQVWISIYGTGHREALAIKICDIKELKP